MAKKVYEENNISNIAVAIREKTGSDKTYKTSEMPSGVNEVYDKGHADGQQAEYDRFWDAYQSNGTRINYQHAFSGFAWNKDTFKPKYNIRISDGYRTFHNFNNISSREPIDLVALLEELGLVLDTSIMASHSYIFQNAKISRVGTINFSRYSALENPFINCYYLETIEELIFKTDGSQIWYDAFTGCTKLKHINSIKGIIGQNASLSPCPLTAQSAITVINALKNYSGTANEYKYKVSFSSTTKANLEVLGNTAPNGDTWLDYAYSKGWNV